MDRGQGIYHLRRVQDYSTCLELRLIFYQSTTFAQCPLTEFHDHEYIIRNIELTANAAMLCWHEAESPVEVWMTEYEHDLMPSLSALLEPDTNQLRPNSFPLEWRQNSHWTERDCIET